MPRKLFDEEGNEVEAYTDDDMKVKVEEATKPLAEKLKGYEDRDYNFEALKKKVMKGEELTQKEREVYDKEKKVEEDKQRLESEKQDWNKKVINSWEDEALTRLVGGDEEAMGALKSAYKDDLGAIVATTQSEIEVKAAKAYALAFGKKVTTSGFDKAVSSAGSSGAKVDKKNFVDTDKGKEVYDALGLIQE